MNRHLVKLAELLVIQPMYKDGHRVGTRLWMTDGRVEEDARSPQSIMRKALAQEGVDLAKYRKTLREETAHRQYLPIVHGNHAYMTCKMQKARVPGDEVYGFVRVDAVKTLEPGAAGTTLVLIGGERLQTLQPRDTVRRHMAEAVFVRQKWARAQAEADVSWQEYRSAHEAPKVDPTLRASLPPGEGWQALVNELQRLQVDWDGLSRMNVVALMAIAGAAAGKALERLEK